MTQHKRLRMDGATIGFNEEIDMLFFIGQNQDRSK